VTRRALVLCALAMLTGLTSCHRVRSFLLGDPDAIPTARTAPPASTESAKPVLIAPPVKAAKPPMKLPDGTLASAEYTEAYDCKTNGQLWRAHLILEPHALSLEGTRDEVKLLQEICKAQGDQECLDKCTAKITGKPVESSIDRLHDLAVKNPKAVRTTLKAKQAKQALSEEELEVLRGACERLKDKACLAQIAGTTASASAPEETTGKGTSIEETRALAMSNPKAARAILEPKVKSKKASQEEVELLCAVCTIQHDKACSATHCGR
jgi:hypothetical protein